MPPDKEANHEALVTQAICVITPCFNAAPFLSACLASAAAQAPYIKKHIIMDGGSTDGSVNILRECSRIDPRVVWRSEPDTGQSDALNKALEMVDTPYFVWLNADDCLIPDALRALVLASQSTPAPTIVYGDYQVISAAGDVIRQRRQPSFNYWDCLYSYLTVQNCAAIFQTEACRATGGFDESLQFCMDYDLILRLAARGRVVHVRKYIGNFRHHEGAKTSRLQHICTAETEQLRLRVSRRTAGGLRWRYWIGAMRVAIRMITEGCVPSRMLSMRSSDNVNT